MGEQQLLDLLVLAFEEDPLYRWLYPDPGTRPAAMRENLALTMSLCQSGRGHVEVSAEGTAVLLWSPPHTPLLEDPAPFLSLLQKWAPDKMEAAVEGMAACARYASADDAVVHVLAVHPAARGSGTGARLLASTLAPLEREGTSAYLESSNARNLSFYKRAGFEQLGAVQVPQGGPVMFPLRRAV